MPYYWNIAPNRDATFTLQTSVRRGLGGRQRIPLPRAQLLRLGRAARDAVRQGSGSFALFAARRSRREPAVRRLRAAARDARLRRQLLEGLPGRRQEPDAAPAAERSAGDASVRRLVDLRAQRCAGRCCRRPIRRRRSSSRPTTASRRSARATARSGAAASTPPSRPSSTASRIPTTTTFSARQTGLRVARHRQHRPAVLFAGLDRDAAGLVQRRGLFVRSAAARRQHQRGARHSDREPRQRLDARARNHLRRPHRSGRRSSRACSTSIRRIAARTSCPTSTPPLKDFNFDSIFTENAFSGIDRVSDSNQMAAGVTSRILDPDTGAEALRVGLAQRYRFREPAHHARCRAADAALLRRARLRLDDAGAALDLRRLGPVQSRPTPHRAVAGRLSLLAGTVSHGRPDLPA